MNDSALHFSEISAASTRWAGAWGRLRRPRFRNGVHARHCSDVAIGEAGTRSAATRAPQACGPTF